MSLCKSASSSQPPGDSDRACGGGESEWGEQRAVVPGYVGLTGRSEARKHSREEVGLDLWEGSNDPHPVGRISERKAGGCCGENSRGK